VAAGKPIADDQVEDMVEEKQPLAHFDAWMKRFAGQCRQERACAGHQDAERSAQTTTRKKKI
jgi:hypothetical protein